MTHIWACSQCHSINRQRNSICYKCALARADGSAVRARPSRLIAAGSSAERAMGILSRAGIPTTMEA